MQREDRFLEDVLRIFHNSKGSIQNIIDKYQSTEHLKETHEDEHIRAQWKPYPEVPFKHASGQYEQLSNKETYVKKNKEIDKEYPNTVHFSDFTKKSTTEDEFPAL